MEQQQAFIPAKPRYTVAEFCTLESMSRRHLYDLLSAGKLRAVKDGRRTYILASDAEAYRRSLPAWQPAQAA